MESQRPIAVVTGVRTPFAKAFTSLQDYSAVELGCASLTEVLRRCGLDRSAVDEVIFGNVAGPPEAMNIARVIALQAGLPHERIAHTVNRNCASGMESILGGWHAINQGRATVVVAGGTESMSKIPLLVHQDAAEIWMQLARSKSIMSRVKTMTRFRLRHFKPVVGIELGLTDPISGLNMGETAEVLAKEFMISRDQQDQFANDSHHKAAAAQAAGFFSNEIVALSGRNGVELDSDNGVRPGQSINQLSKLRPIFDSDGTVTAGNSCQITDGAAAVVLADPADIGRFGQPPLGFITSYAVSGCDPRRMGLGPVYAVAKLLKQTGLTLEEFDLIDINEAFAAQVLACQTAFGSKVFAERELGRSTAIGEWSSDRLNVHGGAIALGHPVGATGTRLVLTLLRALSRTGGRRGLATLCVGGGQGVAMVLETERE